MATFLEKGKLFWKYKIHRKVFNGKTKILRGEIRVKINIF